MRYKTISDCPPERTVKIWDTWEDAYAALQCIDMCGCGGQCIGKTGHRILPITNETKDFQSTELCHACQTPMVRRVRTSVPPSQGSRTFQAEWYHCPKCNKMRKLIDGAARDRTLNGIANFEKELKAKL